MSRVDNTGGSGFTTDNGTGLVVRTKLNQIVAALSTLNQGSGDPTIGVAAYVPHIDGDTLKIRNSANNAFVTLGDVSATNFGHAGLSAANTFTSTNIFQEDVTFDGATAGRDIVFDRSDNALEFADNASLVFGAGSDLTITHDATDSTITSATNDLKITSNGDDLILEAEDDVIIRDNGGSNILAQFINGGACELYHAGTLALTTISNAGIKISTHTASDLVALTDGSTITVDFRTGTHFSVTLGGNRTFGDPNSTGDAVGSSGSIFITQDGTGSRTASFHADYKFAGGTAPTLSTAANAVDRLDYVVKAANVVHAVVTLDVK
jgi:hypothetical protein